MPRKRQSSAASEAIVITESISIETLEDTTVEDYKKLNDKCDKVISRIKVRKERKQKKK